MLFRIVGVSILSVRIDQLHTLDAGILCRWIASCIWELLLADAFDTFGRNQDSLIRDGLVHIRQRLTNYHKQKRVGKYVKSGYIDQLSEITVGMLGDKWAPDLTQCKAAEVRGIFDFL